MPNFGNIDLGGFASSFAQGYQMQMMQQKMEEDRKIQQQNLEMNKLLKEEQTLSLREKRSALEEADRLRRQTKSQSERPMTTSLIPGNTTEDFDMDTPTLSFPVYKPEKVTTIGKSPIEQRFGGYGEDVSSIAQGMGEAGDYKGISEFGKSIALERMKQGSENSFEKVLLKKVQSGEMTLQEALEAKQGGKAPSVHQFTEGDTVSERQWNPKTKQWEVISSGPRYKPQQIVPTDDIEVVAQLLAEGKITMSDISKRGGVSQQAKVLKRASEINPSIDPRGAAAETASYASSLNLQQKQIGQMGSFVKNMEYQVGRVKALGEELKTYDSRIMNLPLRAIRGKIAGSPLQAKYDMYITEIESEIGKLATGSAASISELSVGAQEKWAKIHDKNLSVKDMISLLEETSKAGKMRMKSVEEQYNDTKRKMGNRGNTQTQQTTTPSTPTWKNINGTWKME